MCTDLHPRAFWNNEDELYANQKHAAISSPRAVKYKYILVTFQRWPFTTGVFYSSFGPSASVFSFPQKSQFTCDRPARLFSQKTLWSHVCNPVMLCLQRRCCRWLQSPADGLRTRQPRANICWWQELEFRETTKQLFPSVNTNCMKV